MLWRKSKPYQSGRCMHMGKEKEHMRRNMVLTPPWGKPKNFSFPMCNSTKAWWTQWFSPELGPSTAPLVVPPTCLLRVEETRKIFWHLSLNSFPWILCNQVKYNVGTSKLFRASRKPRTTAHVNLPWWSSVLEYSMLSPRHGHALSSAAELFAEAKISVPRGALIPCIFKGSNSDTFNRSRTNSWLFLLFSSTNRWLWAELKWDLEWKIATFALQPLITRSH